MILNNAAVVNMEKQEIYFWTLVKFDTNYIKPFFCLEFGVMFIFSAYCVM